MNKLVLFFKGALMGACDVIPGVSGGTIAFITGIYDELIDALHTLNFGSLKLLFTGKFKLFRKTIHGNFLITLFAGIIISILTLVKVIDYLLITYPVLLRAFFFGLILASIFILRKTIKKRKKQYIILLALGVLIGFILTTLPIVQMGGGSIGVFASGMIAIIAMILPGISGSYILVVLGQYQNILGNVVDAMGGNIGAIISVLIFIAGAIIGLTLFSKLLHYIKTRWHDQLMIVLIGFMLGSLNKVRPRKETIETFIDRHGKIQPLIQKNILPNSLNEVLITMGVAIVGVGVVFGVTYLSKKLAK